MEQSWLNLLFAHWPLPPEALRPLIPKSLPLDTFEGEAWIAVVPFHMSGIRLRGLPLVPGTSRFAELNVRTYVTLNGKPGVYFFSLDAAHSLAVWMARTFCRLPYHLAEMSVETDGEERVSYYSRRVKEEGFRFEGTYRPISEPYLAEAGTLEHWLTERYCLYTLDGGGGPLRCDIDHEPWPLQQAEAKVDRNTMTSAQGIRLPDRPPLLHYAARLDVRIWPLVRA